MVVFMLILLVEKCASWAEIEIVRSRKYMNGSASNSNAQMIGDVWIRGQSSADPQMIRSYGCCVD